MEIPVLHFPRMSSFKFPPPVYLFRLPVVVLLVALFASPGAWALLEIEVSGGASNRIAVALVPFQGGNNLPTPALTEIIGNDLLRSGQIRLVDTSDGQQTYEPSQINYAQWRSKGTDAMLVGQALNQPDGRIELRFRLMDVVKQTQLAGLSLTVTPTQWRAAAHKIADVIYQKLTGQAGVFSSRIAYITKRGKRFELIVADADGQNPHMVVRSGEPLISPVFSQDGQRIAYVSFEAKKPIVFVQSLRDGSRRAVAAFKGSNSAPAWSPDGTRLAVTLTRDNGSQIYLINADGSGLNRLTNSSAIDTEPTWSPDGRYIYFTSDRGGSPQIYRIAATGGDVKRVTFDGNYNVSPDISPDGKYMAFIQRDAGRFRVALMDLAAGQTHVLTDTAYDESPSFAPNGQLILYATVANGHGILGTVTLDGRTRARLSEDGSDAREPAWGN